MNKLNQLALLKKGNLRLKDFERDENMCEIKTTIPS